MTATMSWELDREHEEFRASVRSFVDRQVRRVVEESEEAGRPPAASIVRYFGGGLMNVADNCVDRWAEDPATAGRAAVIWEGEPGDVRTLTYADRWQVGPEEGDVYWVAADVGWLTFPIQAVVGGLANGMTVACFEGAMDTPSNARFYEICEKHHVTKVLGAPTLLRMLRKYGDELAAAHPLPALKLVTVQGEPLDGDTFTWATRHLGGGVPVINAYGQTGTGSTWAYSVAGVEALKPGSTGTAVPGHVYDIVAAEAASRA
jgi:acyl-coenzyme A synthetase/AMP-(fatty) acid ligase